MTENKKQKKMFFGFKDLKLNQNHDRKPIVIRRLIGEMIENWSLVTKFLNDYWFEELFYLSLEDVAKEVWSLLHL